MDLERIRNIAERVAGSEGLELVAVEWAGRPGQGVLRIIIDHPQGGTSHRHCQAVSEQVGAILDVEDLIPGHYVLEVASPGLDRKLYQPADYERFGGRRVKVRLKQRSAAVGGRRFTATLAGLADGLVSFDVDGQTVEIPYEQIDAVHLVIEL